MTWQDIILEVMKDLGTADTSMIKNEIQERISSSSLYYSLRRLEDRKVIKVDRSGYRNRYTFSAKYQKFVYTIRVIETKSVKPINRWGKNGESVSVTVEGTVPYGTTEDQIRKLHRKKLEEEMYNILSTKDPPVLSIPDRLIITEDMQNKGISGVELGEIVDKYDKDLKVEVEFVNSQGQLYDKSDGFDGSYQTKLEDY